MKQGLYAEAQTLKSCAEASTGTQFGYMVAISADDNVVVVGAPKSNANSVSGAGAAYIFERNLSKAGGATCKTCHSSGNFVLVQSLVAPEPDNDDQSSDNRNFGTAVTISGNGNTIIVGAPFQSVGNDLDTGKVFVYRRRCKEFMWKLAQTIVAQQRTSDTDCTVIADQDAKRGFGEILALSRNGRVLAVGDPQAVLDQKSGLGYVYEASSEKSEFVFRQRVTLAQVLADIGVSFSLTNVLATSLAINGDGSVIALGGSVDAAFCTGRVFIYRRLACPRDGCVFYELTQSIADSAFTFFGCALALTPDAQYLAIEASSRSRVYRQQCVDGEPWPQFVADGAPLISPSDANFLLFKQRSIAISDRGCVVAVGYEQTPVSSTINAGDVAIFDKQVANDGSITWSLRQRITEEPAPRQQANFGASISISGDAKTLVVGAPFAADLVDMAYVYQQ